MKKIFIGIVMISVLLTGCEMTQIQQQQEQKIQQAERVMEQTKVPVFSHSLERDNIRQRLIISNDANTLQWIYPMSAGRVIGRFPVKGKVTSGSKRLTSSQGYILNQGYTEMPDEMGTYGSSGDYIFWFDPAGRIHQHKGDYFVSPVPYRIDSGLGTITVDIDSNEEAKRSNYDKQIEESNKAAKKQQEPSTTPVAQQGGK